MPGTKQVLDRTAHEIEQYLESKKQPAAVAARVIAVTAGNLEIDFTPSRGLPAVANVIFEGSKAISATDLRNKIGEVAFGQTYTENGFRVLLDNQIRALYEAKGYMRVAFPKIVTEPSAQVQGIDVKVTVDEGEQYKLGRVIVGGRMASDSARILKTAKLPQMTVANVDQVKEGAVRVRDSLRHQGYLDADVTTDRKLDDTKKTIDFTLLVETGPEYTQGKLTVNGLGLDGEAAIRKMWAVKEGDPFPIEYPDFFLARVKEEGLFDNLGDMKARTDVNRESHIVDVTLDFKGTGPKERTPRR
jgi:outer membrane protein insertion porin family